MVSSSSSHILSHLVFFFLLYVFLMGSLHLSLPLSPTLLFSSYFHVFPLHCLFFYSFLCLSFSLLSKPSWHISTMLHRPPSLYYFILSQANVSFHCYFPSFEQRKTLDSKPQAYAQSAELQIPFSRSLPAVYQHPKGSHPVKEMWILAVKHPLREKWQQHTSIGHVCPKLIGNKDIVN